MDGSQFLGEWIHADDDDDDDPLAPGEISPSLLAEDRDEPRFSHKQRDDAEFAEHMAAMEAERKRRDPDPEDAPRLVRKVSFRIPQSANEMADAEELASQVAEENPVMQSEMIKAVAETLGSADGAFPIAIQYTVEPAVPVSRRGRSVGVAVSGFKRARSFKAGV
jgi:hypothetical protein